MSKKHFKTKKWQIFVTTINFNIAKLQLCCLITRKWQSDNNIYTLKYIQYIPLYTVTEPPFFCHFVTNYKTALNINLERF